MSATMTRSPAVRLGRPGIARPDFERTLTDTYDPCKQAESVNLSFAHATLFWHFKFVPIFGCLWHGVDFAYGGPDGGILSDGLAPA